MTVVVAFNKRQLEAEAHKIINPCILAVSVSLNIVIDRQKN